MVEKILFIIISFGLFIFFFLKMIQKNDTNYIYMLAMQAIGIVLKLLSFLFGFDMPIVLTALIYLLSIIIPIIMIFLELKVMSLTEIICFLYVHICKDDEKKKNMIMKFMEKNPHSFFGHKVLAEIFEKEGKFDIAAEEYMRALEENKNDINIKYKIAFSLNNINKKDDAQKLLNEILKDTPDYTEASLLLVDIMYEKEMFREAISICYDALKYKADNYELYYNLGMLFTRLNDFQTAKDYYLKAAEINSLSHMPKYNLGQISMIQDELDEAEQYFLDCINNECEEDGSYYYLAYIQMLKGDKQKAIEYLNIAVQENEKYYKKAEKEVLFRFIIARINKPVTSKEEKNKLSKKEEQTIAHLEKTYEVVSRLNNNDLKVMKNIEKQKERE